MGLTSLSVTQAVSTGATPSFTAANSDGHYFENDGKVFVVIRNTGVETTVTLQTPGTIGGAAVTEQTVTVLATTGESWIGPFKPSVYNQYNGVVNITFSQVTGLTACAYRL